MGRKARRSMKEHVRKQHRLQRVLLEKVFEAHMLSETEHCKLKKR